MAKRVALFLFLSLPLLIFCSISMLGNCNAISLKQTSQALLLIDNVPHLRQRPDFCGEACVAMVLQKLGSKLDQDAVFDRSGLSPLEGRGCYTRELVAAVKGLGFEPGQVWYSIPTSDSQSQLQSLFESVRAGLVSGYPSIVCTRFDQQPNASEHFRLIIGYDPRSDEIIYHDPALEQGKSLRMKRTELLSLWPLKYDSKNWTAVWIPMQLKSLPPGTPSDRFTNADFAQHIMKLQPQLTRKQFHAVVQPPFVVLGDESKEVVEQRSKSTIQWAVDHLMKDYFKREPGKVITIWLFKDAKSYQQNCKELFDLVPTTPYGFYSTKHEALLMDISTGGGTLVHEIVHPFMASNFPKCPSWFNEGLASLYEQSDEREGHIIGLVNWRLPGLQTAIKRKQLTTFQELMATSTNEFYNDPRLTNYAQARYLCYYLQEKGKLQAFYRGFAENASTDATGIETLKKVLQQSDLTEFQSEWETFVLGLSR